jgi:hypothetical protein
LHLLKWAFDILAESERNFQARLQMLLWLGVPLLIACGIAWLVGRTGRMRLAISLGVIYILAAYMTLCLRYEYQISECQRMYPGAMCGEWSFLRYMGWLGMYIVDTLALVGMSYWFDRLHKETRARKFESAAT